MNKITLKIILLSQIINNNTINQEEITKALKENIVIPISIEDLQSYSNEEQNRDWTHKEKMEIAKIIHAGKHPYDRAIEIYKAEEIQRKIGKGLFWVYSAIGVLYACQNIAAPLINSYFAPYIKKYTMKNIFKNSLIAKNTNIIFKDLRGYKDIEKRCKRIIKRLRKQLETKEYEKMDGVCFFGQPGCGKTVFAQALANEAGIPFYIVKASDLVNEQGQTENRIDLLFNQMLENVTLNGPCILFLDEVDFILKNRKNGNLNSNEQLILQNFLNRLDGEISLKGLLVICNTNDINALDEALLRPGRIGELIEFKAPDKYTIIELIELYSKKSNIIFDNFDISAEYLSNRLFNMNISQIIKFITELSEYSKEIKSPSISQSILENFIEENNY